MRHIIRKLPLACFLLLACLLAPASLFAQTFSGECVGVSDGDTIKILRDGRETKVRLEGIDCPESGEPFSLVARVLIDGQDVSVGLVQAGLAWHYTKYSSDPALAQAEKTARAAEIGIWSLPNPLPPWELKAQKAQAASAVSTSEKPDTIYHGNRKSHVFHAPWCRYYSCKNCTVIFHSREEAVKAGYKPGGHCRTLGPRVAVFKGG